VHPLAVDPRQHRAKIDDGDGLTPRQPSDRWRLPVDRHRETSTGSMARGRSIRGTGRPASGIERAGLVGARPTLNVMDARALDRVAHGGHDLADLSAQEDQGDNRDDGDECEDQGVLSEALAFLVTIGNRIDKRHDCHVELKHLLDHLLSFGLPAAAGPELDRRVSPRLVFGRVRGTAM